ncbi:MAG: hypothetical protein ACW964_05805 [Candidatus Hodarchaeales archaeon]|jgi:hypothetical protein
MNSHGYCPYRIQTRRSQVGCAIRKEKEELCYSQEIKPMIYQNEGFYCSKHQVKISKDIYIKIEKIIDTIVTMQGVESTICYNLWPMMKRFREFERMKYTYQHDNDDDHPPMAT